MLIVIKETYLRHVKSWSFVFMVLSPFLFLGLSLGIVAISFGEVDGYTYNYSFMTGNLKKTMVAYGNFVRDRKIEFFWESLFMTSLIGSFVGGAILSTFLIQYYGLRTIWFVSLVLIIFLSYRAIQYVRRDI